MGCVVVATSISEHQAVCFQVCSHSQAVQLTQYAEIDENLQKAPKLLRSLSPSYCLYCLVVSSVLNTNVSLTWGPGVVEPDIDGRLICCGQNTLLQRQLEVHVFRDVCSGYSSARLAVYT